MSIERTLRRAHGRLYHGRQALPGKKNRTHWSHLPYLANGRPNTKMKAAGLMPRLIRRLIRRLRGPEAAA